ncbi:Uncharacterised protein [Vibrio cholerae]|nr:Uncharacterised protein [Vibrio cholerae]
MFFEHGSIIHAIDVITRKHHDVFGITTRK